MHRLIVVMFFALPGCATCPVCPAAAPCPEPVVCPDCPEVAEEPEGPRTWFVLRAIDGDTLVLRLEGATIERKETVRLLNIDTPEKKEPLFDEAREALKTLVRAGTVTLEFEDPRAERRDGFGRLLVYVIADGVNANLELVRQGMSRYYTKYGKGRLEAEFREAEGEAKEAKRGVWGLPD